MISITVNQGNVSTKVEGDTNMLLTEVAIMVADLAQSIGKEINVSSYELLDQIMQRSIMAIMCVEDTEEE